MVESEELFAVFENGSSYSNCTSSLTTLIQFECDVNADWEFIEGDDVTSYFKNLTIDVENPCSVS